MRLSHVGTKTYYVYDRTGTLRPVSTRAYCVKELNPDLLAGRGLTNADYQVILDKHEFIAGIYPVGDDGTVSHWLVSSRKACSIFELNQLMHQNMQNCRAMIYGIEDLGTVQMKIIAKQFLTQSG
jgi:hypothetical protein